MVMVRVMVRGDDDGDGEGTVKTVVVRGDGEYKGHFRTEMVW